jgi:hypothetical protein
VSQGPSFYLSSLQDKWIKIILSKPRRSIKIFYRIPITIEKQKQQLKEKAKYQVVEL